MDLRKEKSVIKLSCQYDYYYEYNLYLCIRVVFIILLENYHTIYFSRQNKTNN